MSSHYFFTSGHQATIPSIRFEAAFVGLPGDMKNIHLPGNLDLKKHIVCLACWLMKRIRFVLSEREQNNKLKMPKISGESVKGS